jgi:hypothetical protein
MPIPPARANKTKRAKAPCTVLFFRTGFADFAISPYNPNAQVLTDYRLDRFAEILILRLKTIMRGKAHDHKEDNNDG